MFALALTLLLNFGCRNKDVTDTAAADLDGDGYRAAIDCDDENPDVYPDAEEICDGLDNNCDGTIDEGLTETWYVDADGDGFGDAASPAELCDALEGYAESGDDCDDENAEIFPGATELCNGVDDNCDGTIDEAGDAPWYEDADGDGYGNPDVSLSECDPEGSWVPDGTDCDDEDPDINPGVDDICNLQDDDCDGDIDEDPEFLWYMDLDGDGWGSSTETSACSQPDNTSPDTGDCDDSDADINPDAEEVCDGEDNNCDGDIDEDEAVDASSWYTDGDGDGFGDDSSATTSCDQPSNTVADGGDCDDGDDAINPDAEEVCDQVDNDCNGTVDDDYATDADTWYADTDGDGFGDPNSSTSACDQPSNYVDNDDDCDDGAGDINPDAEEVCFDGVDDNCSGTADEDCPVEHCGTISSDETWDATTDHIVTCTTYVQGSTRPVLTIADGATVYFDAGASLWVGWGSYGSIEVEGTSAGVTFTSYDSSPAEGDWDALTIGYYDQGSDLEGLTLEYGGGYGYGGLYLYYADIEITNSTFQYNEGDGLYAYYASPLIQDSTFQDNTGSGVALSSSAGLDRSGSPSFTGNTLTGNGDYAMEIPGNFVGELDATSSFSGNTDDYILIVSDTIGRDATWQALDAPYNVQDTQWIQGTNRPEVTIEDGAEFYMQSDVHLYVGWSNYGTVMMEGGTSGITFTSAESSPAAGDWEGINIGYYDEGSVLEGVTVEYGGDNGYGCLFSYYSDVEITDSTFSDCDNDGLYVYGTAEVLVTGSTFENNGNNGITLQSAAELDDSSTPSFTDNTLTGNSNYPISLPGNELGQLDSSSSFSGNGDDYIAVLTDYVTDDATWQAHDVDYHVDGTLYIQGSGRPEVTVEDGVTMAFDDSGIWVGWSNYGDLTLDGGTSGITFTSADSSPSAGDWGGVTLGYYTSQTQELTGFTIEYGGDNGYGGLFVYYADAEISDCTLSDNDGDGVYVTSGTLDVDGCSRGPATTRSTSTSSWSTTWRMAAC